MKIGVFAYDFPHYKSQQGLLHLMATGLKPTVVLAQKKLKLDIEYSNIRIIPRRIFVNETENVAKAFGIPYIKCLHDSGEVEKVIKYLRLDIGVVLGARILKKNTIEAFNKGILNMHPGIIPANRGLDNIKWAVLDNLKQGVTTHFIDERVDMGRIVNLREVIVYPDDTLSDIQMRVHEVELMAMVRVLRQYKDKKMVVEKIVKTKGKYNRPLTMDEEVRLLNKFEYYKTYYHKMRIGWK